MYLTHGKIMKSNVCGFEHNNLSCQNTNYKNRKLKSVYQNYLPIQANTQ